MGAPAITVLHGHPNAGTPTPYRYLSPWEGRCNHQGAPAVSLVSWGMRKHKTQLEAHRAQYMDVWLVTRSGAPYIRQIVIVTSYW